MTISRPVYKLFPKKLAALRNAVATYANWRWDYKRLQAKKNAGFAEEARQSKVKMEQSGREMLTLVDPDLLAAMVDRLDFLEEETKRREKEQGDGQEASGPGNRRD